LNKNYKASAQYEDFETKPVQLDYDIMSAMTDTNSFSHLKDLAGESAKGILKPHDNDVLFGRGGSINVHPGNEEFRRIVHRYKEFYSAARYKKEKRLIADEIITVIENKNPPGRFLAKDSSTGLWHPVGYEKARNKASQALRENGSLLKANALIENEALHAELKKCNEQDARRFAGQCDAFRHGHPSSYNDYHNENTIPPVHRNTMPSLYRNENVNSSELHTFNGLVYTTPFYNNTVNDCQLKSDRIPAVEGKQNNENKMYGTDRIKDIKEVCRNVRPPKVSYDIKPSVRSDTPETTRECPYLTSTITEASYDTNHIMSPSLGGDNKGVMPVVIDDKVRQLKTKENKIRENEMKNLVSSSVFGCHTKEETFNPMERFTSIGDITLQTIEVDDSDTIGGQSLVNVFDGDGMRNREISDVSMLSDL